MTRNDLVEIIASVLNNLREVSMSNTLLSKVILETIESHCLLDVTRRNEQ